MTPEEQLANTMDLIANLANTFIAGAASYREQCIAAGFNETAAEQMALAMHQALVARALMDIGGAS
jgi:hypothetical protein